MNNIALIQSLINENAEAHLEKEVPVFKTMLVKYYEDDDKEEISKFLITKCWKKMNA